MLKGVLPVPPIKIFPTQIIGILNLYSEIINDFKFISSIVIKENGNKKIEIKFISFQNVGLLYFIF